MIDIFLVCEKQNEDLETKKETLSKSEETRGHPQVTSSAGSEIQVINFTPFTSQINFSSTKYRILVKFVLQQTCAKRGLFSLFFC